LIISVSASQQQPAGVLNQTVWPSDPLQRALFGEADIANICNDLCIESAESANILLDFAMYKKGQAAGRHLVKLLCTLHILPISSAAFIHSFIHYSFIKIVLK